MIKVLIVDDQELFRESLKVVLSVSGSIQVSDAVSSVAEALKSAARDRPCVCREWTVWRAPGCSRSAGPR